MTLSLLCVFMRLDTCMPPSSSGRSLLMPWAPIMIGRIYTFSARSWAGSRLCKGLERGTSCRG